MAFRVMLKGNRKAPALLAIPSSHSIAAASREAERASAAERAEIRRLVLEADDAQQDAEAASTRQTFRLAGGGGGGGERAPKLDLRELRGVDGMR